MNKKIKLQDLVELAQEVEYEDPLQWQDINIDSNAAYTMMAAHVLEQFDSQDDPYQKLTMMGVITKLLVENFLLNVRLSQKQG